MIAGGSPPARHLTPWQEAVIDAAREFDPLDLCQKLEKACAVVRERISSLCEECNDPDERHALVEALDAIHILGRCFSSYY
jgi:hypothetical protein